MALGGAQCSPPLNITLLSAPMSFRWRLSCTFNRPTIRMHLHLLNSNACHMPNPSQSPCFSDKDTSTIREALHRAIFCTLRLVPQSLRTLFSNTDNFLFPYIPSSTHCAHNIHILALWSQSWSLQHQTMESSNTEQSFATFKTLTNWQVLSGKQVKNDATARKTIIPPKINQSV
jgi:hypothetical protein